MKLEVLNSIDRVVGNAEILEGESPLGVLMNFNEQVAGEFVGEAFRLAFRNSVFGDYHQAKDNSFVFKALLEVGGTTSLIRYQVLRETLLQAGSDVVTREVVEAISRRVYTIVIELCAKEEF